MRIALRSTRARSLAMVLLAGLSVGCRREAPPPPQPAAAAVDVAKPVVREVTEWDEYTGRMAAVEKVEVRPRVSGYLESVNFKEGQLVKKGDLLFVIDPRPFRAALTAAEADVSGARTRLELAKNDQQRVEGLVATRAVSAEEVDKRVKAAVEAQASLDAAAARVERARLDVEFTEIRAPIAGRVSRYEVTVGNLINGGMGEQSTLLTTIVSLDPIHCYFDASEQDYLKYTRLAASGARPSSRDVPNPVKLALVDLPDAWHDGRMDFVDNRIDQGTGTMRGRAIFANPDHALVPGLFAKVRLIGETKPNAVLVPDLAIGADQSNRVVYVVDDKNVVAQRTVTTGRLIDGMRVVRTGLDGSERVVVRGVQRVRPGATVAPRAVSIGADGAIVEDPAAGKGGPR